jgi:hypothetical protein
MASMTDPMAALVSFQHALLDGEIRLRAGELDPDLFVYAGNLAPGVSRITYVRLDGRTVTAFVNVVANGPMDGLPCFQLSVAVPVQYPAVQRQTIHEILYQHNMADKEVHVSDLPIRSRASPRR